MTRLIDDWFDSYLFFTRFTVINYFFKLHNDLEDTFD